MGKSNHTLEFRENAVKLALSSDIPISETADSLGITRALLYSWIKAKRQPKETRELMNSNHDLQKENKTLKKEIQRLKEEKEILKKAAAYFARNPV
jgi:transposase